MEDFERPKTRVQWLLGNNCNYKCSYCHEMFRMGDKPFPSKELISDICQEIIYHYDDLGRDVVFDFVGGEPTLAADLNDIGKKFHNHPVNVVLKTNGSASLEWWKKSRRYLSDVVISVHREFCDLNHIKDVIHLLQDETFGYPVNVKVLIPATHNEDSWKWAKKTRYELQSLFDVGEIQLLYSNFARGSDMYYPYSKSQWDDYKSWHKEFENVEVEKAMLFKRKENNFLGYKCYAGIDQLTIDSDGDIWRGWCREGGVIGNINQMPIAWPKDTIICNKEICKNGFDLNARKEEIISSSSNS